MGSFAVGLSLLYSRRAIRRPGVIVRRSGKAPPTLSGFAKASASTARFLVAVRDWLWGSCTAISELDFHQPAVASLIAQRIEPTLS